MSNDSTILVIGATGYTGRLVAEYLGNYPNPAFKLQLGGRSPSKVDALISELNLEGVVPVIFDTLKADQVDRAIQGASVIINCAGPFYRYGSLVLAACARHGRHYADITGEPWWVMEMIEKYDYLASKTGATIVPFGAFDSVPSDVVSFLGVQKLKEVAGSDVKVGKSITAHSVKGGISGGTLATLLSAFTDVPSATLSRASAHYSLSPIKGVSKYSPKLWYSFPREIDVSRSGCYYAMEKVNVAAVQRTWGLYESGTHSDESTKDLKYGQSFDYVEFMALPTGRLFSTLVSVILLGGVLLLAIFPPVRWLAQHLFPQAGTGPSEEVRKNGRYEATNITLSIPSPSSPSPRYVRTTLSGKGDPGYSLAALMVSEVGLALLPSSRSKLTPIGQKGGILTPMSACGFTLVERLNATDRVSIESEEVVPGQESRKAR